jgi:hypothetical protein
MRLVVRTRTILSLDLDQDQRLIDREQTFDDTSVVDQGPGVVKLPSSMSGYVELVKPTSMTRITFLGVYTDAPILMRLNSVDGTTGTEIPITPILTPALSQANPAPSPQTTPSVQKGPFIVRGGGSADGNSVSITSVWLRNVGVTPATVNIEMLGE